MRKGQYRFIAGFLLVPLALYLIFVIWPYIQTFGYSMTNWTGQSPAFDFIGLDNYTEAVPRRRLPTAVWHNIVLLVFIPVFTILIALFFAFMVNVGGRAGSGVCRGSRGSGFYKMVFFFPQVLSLAIIAVLFQAVYRSDPGGLLNGAPDEARAGRHRQPHRMAERPQAVLWCLMVVLVWRGVGFYLVLFSAAMQSIPKEIYEAALLDGAGRAQTFFRVTFRCCGTPYRPRGSISASWRWTCSSWRRP